jgi:hypothetical protein
LERIGRSDRIAAGVSTSNPAERRQEDGWRPDGRDAMTSTRTAAGAGAAAPTATLGLAAASWVVAVQQMDGMDMGVATELGSFATRRRETR